MQARTRLATVLVTVAVLIGLVAGGAHAAFMDVYYALTDPGLNRPGVDPDGPGPLTDPWEPYVEGPGGTGIITLNTCDTLWVAMDNLWVPEWGKHGFIEVDYDTNVDPMTVDWTSEGYAYDEYDLDPSGGHVYHEGPYAGSSDHFWTMVDWDHSLKIGFTIWPQPSWEWIDVHVTQDGTRVNLLKGWSECTVPEPTSMSLLAIAVVGGAAALRRRRVG
jgi:hypothetical protein